MYIQTDGKRVQNLIGHCLNGTCEPMQKKYVHTFLKACPRGLKMEFFSGMPCHYGEDNCLQSRYRPYFRSCSSIMAGLLMKIWIAGQFNYKRWCFLLFPHKHTGQIGKLSNSEWPKVTRVNIVAEQGLEPSPTHWLLSNMNTTVYQISSPSFCKS